MNRFLAAADSIFDYIRNTAEPDGNGVRWRTYDYADQSHYHFNIFNGVGGIPLFLCEYYKARKHPEALTLAERAVRWCMSAKPEEDCFERGLQLGRTGVAYAALVLAEISPSDTLLSFAAENGRHLCHEAPGPITDFVSGEASNGWFLLKLWIRTGDQAFLDGAVRCAEWIEGHIVRERGWTFCLAEPVEKSFGENAFTGLSHGTSGVAVFLAFLFEQTGNERWKNLSLELFQTLTSTAVKIHGGLNWSVYLGGTELPRCQYSHGSAGIGLAYARAATLLQEPSLLAVALRAGKATYHYGDFRKNPTLCTGVAGSGELMIELFLQTGDGLWLQRAEHFGDMALGYKVTTPEGDRWPTDTPGLFSPDFTYGASGTGHFLLGLVDPHHHAPPLI